MTKTTERLHAINIGDQVEDRDADSEPAECHNPLCTETLTCDPGDQEGYCSWDCAVIARSGAANRIRSNENSPPQQATPLRDGGDR